MAAKPGQEPGEGFLAEGSMHTSFLPQVAGCARVAGILAFFHHVQAPRYTLTTLSDLGCFPRPHSNAPTHSPLGWAYRQFILLFIPQIFIESLLCAKASSFRLPQGTFVFPGGEVPSGSPGTGVSPLGASAPFRRYGGTSQDSGRSVPDAAKERAPGIRWGLSRPGEICQEVPTHLAEALPQSLGAWDEQAALTQTAGSSLSRAVTQEDIDSWKWQRPGN